MYFNNSKSDGLNGKIFEVIVNDHKLFEKVYDRIIDNISFRE